MDVLTSIRTGDIIGYRTYHRLPQGGIREGYSRAQVLATLPNGNFRVATINPLDPASDRRCYWTLTREDILPPF